jgi:[acyl-carrier-protein] S-malonyltransferase
MAALLFAPGDDVRAAVEAACAEASAGGELASPANFNGGGQVVIAGHKAAVERAGAAAKARGAKKVIPLPVSAPFHCALMRPAAERLAAELAKVSFRSPAVPVVTNVEAAPNQDGERVRDLLTRQVTAPVLWEQSVQRIAAMGVTAAVEVGHGAVLTGLLRRIGVDIEGICGDPEATAALLSSREDIAHA